MCLAAGGLAIVLGFAFRFFRPDLEGEETPWGVFSTSAKVELLDDGRLLKLLEDFEYVDPRGRVWKAPRGLVIDGASIPQACWSIVGGPLEGRYRNASIVHDQECEQMMHAWEDVHFMFYEACRCGGVPERQAKVLYFAVYHFGPRWKHRKVYQGQPTQDPGGKVRDLTVERTVADRLPVAEPPSPAQVNRLQRLIEAENPPLEALRSMNPAEL